MDVALKRRELKLSVGQRAFMIATAYVPFLNVVVVATLIYLAGSGTWPRWTWALPFAWLLIVPPVVVRLTLWLRPLSTTSIPLYSPAFFVWWITAQWQVIFNRLPWIEEMIRLVPGLYSTWMRLWGAKIGRLVYWTPGLRILDRSLVEIGDHVSFGMGVKINPHIIMPDETGQLVLRVATVRIGNDALVGGYSLWTAGTWIAPGEATPGKREMRPFTGWEAGRRVTADTQTENEDD
jgi:hypothetical protein